MMDQATFERAVDDLLDKQDKMSGLFMYGGAGECFACTEKVVTMQYKVAQDKRNMPEPCRLRNAAERKKNAEDINILYDTLSNRSCGCALHDKGCFNAVAYHLGFSAPDAVVQIRIKARYSGDSWRKTAALNLEEIIHRLIDRSQQKFIPRFPPDQNGKLVCRDAFLYLMHVPLATFTDMLQKVNDPDAELTKQHKKLQKRLAQGERGPVAENQIGWLRAQIGDAAQNPPNRTIAKKLLMYIPVLATVDDPDEGIKGRKMRKPPVQLWYMRYLTHCANDDRISADEMGSLEYFRVNLKKAAAELGVEISNNHGILGDCFVCSYVCRTLSSKSHASKSDKEHAHKVEQAHSDMIRRLRNEVKDSQQASARYFQGKGGDSIYFEQDGMGKQNTFLPFLAHNRSKSAGSASDLLQLHFMLHIVAGLGMFLVWSPLFIKGGADFNMTCWWTVLMHMTGELKLTLPRRWNFHSDRGDGNWSVATLGFYALLCALGFAEEVYVGAYPKDHGHCDVDREMAILRHYLRGNRRKNSCSGSNMLVPFSYGMPGIEKWGEDEYDVSVEGAVRRAYNSKKERMKAIFCLQGADGYPDPAHVYIKRVQSIHWHLRYASVCYTSYKDLFTVCSLC
jgi:hypothetical protein